MAGLDLFIGLDLSVVLSTTKLEVSWNGRKIGYFSWWNTKDIYYSIHWHLWAIMTCLSYKGCLSRTAGCLFDICIFMKIEVFWDVTLCHWASFFIFRVTNLRRGCLSLKMKELWNPLKHEELPAQWQCNTPEDLDLQQHNCEDLKTDVFTFACIGLLLQKLGIIIV